MTEEKAKVMSAISETLAALKILPVLTVKDVDEAIALCQALKQGGIKAVEITLRTPAAMDALREVKRAFPDLLVAAGTVNSVQAMDAVNAAGVDFALSPGMTPALIQRAQVLGLPFVPGVATASEILKAMEFGVDCFKLFPAEVSGGVNLLKAWAEPLAGISFCPTGGVSEDNFRSYLALPNVLCVGGSWIAPKSAIAEQDWGTIVEKTRAALATA